MREKHSELWFFGNSKIAPFSYPKYEKYLKLFFKHSNSCTAQLNEELLIFALKLKILHKFMPENYQQKFADLDQKIHKYLENQLKFANQQNREVFNVILQNMQKIFKSSQGTPEDVTKLIAVSKVDPLIINSELEDNIHKYIALLVASLFAIHKMTNIPGIYFSFLCVAVAYNSHYYLKQIEDNKTEFQAKFDEIEQIAKAIPFSKEMSYLFTGFSEIKKNFMSDSPEDYKEKLREDTARKKELEKEQKQLFEEKIKESNRRAQEKSNRENKKIKQQQNEANKIKAQQEREEKIALSNRKNEEKAQKELEKRRTQEARQNNKKPKKKKKKITKENKTSQKSEENKKIDQKPTQEIKDIQEAQKKQELEKQALKKKKSEIHKSLSCRNSEEYFKLHSNCHQIHSKLLELETYQKLPKGAILNGKGSFLYQHYLNAYASDVINPEDIDFEIIAPLDNIDENFVPNILKAFGLSTNDYTIKPWRGRTGEGSIENISLKPIAKNSEKLLDIFPEQLGIEFTIRDPRFIRKDKEWIANFDSIRCNFSQQGYQLRSVLEPQISMKQITDDIKSEIFVVNGEASSLERRLDSYEKRGILTKENTTIIRRKPNLIPPSNLPLVPVPVPFPVPFVVPVNFQAPNTTVSPEIFVPIGRNARLQQN